MINFNIERVAKQTPGGILGDAMREIYSMHKAVCTTAERESYYPTLGQQIFDTDLNKMLICIDPENRKWVDMNGNAIN